MCYEINIKKYYTTLFLAYTRLKKYWPSDEKIYLANKSIQYQINNIDFKNFKIKGNLEEPFNRDNIQDSYKQIYLISQKLLKILPQRLNKIHKKKYSINYWRSHLSFWLFDYVSFIFYCYKLLEFTKDNNQEIKVAKGVNINSFEPPVDYLNFLDLAGYEPNHELHQSLFSYTAEYLGIQTIVVKQENEKKENIDSKYREKYLFKSKIINFLKDLYSCSVEKFIARRSKIIMYGTNFPKKFSMKIFLKSNFNIFEILIRRMNNSDYKNIKKNKNYREIISKKSNKLSEFENYILSTMQYFIPKSYLENYKDVIDFSETNYYGYRPKIIFSPNSWWVDHAFVHWASVCREGGSITVSGHHSAGPIILARDIYFSEIEVSNTDYYLSSENSNINYGKIFNAPANILIKYQNNRRVVKDKILYVFCNQASYVNRVLEDYSGYIEFQINFLNSVSQNIFKKLIGRIHREEFGWNLEKILERRVKDLKISNKNLFAVDLFECKLCIHSYLGTTFYQSLSYNIPTLVLIDKDYNIIGNIDETMTQHKMNLNLKDDIEALKNAGIIHDSIESINKWFDNHYMMIEEWWNCENRQKLINSFCKKYSWVDAKPENKWINVLEQINAKD